jgi:hypothetical protein
VTRIPEPSREAQRIDKREFFRFGALRSVACYFDRWGLLTDWYWPARSHGKLWNFFHGHGWRIT